MVRPHYRHPIHFSFSVLSTTKNLEDRKVVFFLLHTKYNLLISANHGIEFKAQNSTICRDEPYLFEFRIMWQITKSAIVNIKRFDNSDYFQRPITKKSASIWPLVAIIPIRRFHVSIPTNQELAN